MKVVFLLQGEGLAVFFRQAYSELDKRYQDRLDIQIMETMDLDREQQPESFLQYFGNPDFFYLDIHGGLPYFRSFDPFWREVESKVPAFVRTDIEDENLVMRRSGSIPAYLYDCIMKYRDAQGVENMKSILLILLREFGGCGEIQVPEIALPRWHGIYGQPVHAGEDNRTGGMFEGGSCAGKSGSGRLSPQQNIPVKSENRSLSLREERDYLEHIRKEKEDKIVAGILIHYHYILQRDTDPIDALMEAVRGCGAEPLAVYSNMMPSEDGFGGLKDTIRQYLKVGREPLVDVLIVTTGHSLTALAAPGDGREYSRESVFEELDVPVIQAMTTFYTLEQWKASLVGMDPMFLCSNVYQPEFDGQIIGFPIACTEQIMTKYGAKSHLVPIRERVEKTARLAVNWGRLRRIPQNQKKIALILHNMPPRADMIGCAYGLDTPESIFGICQLLKEKGISLDYEFENGQQIIKKIIEGATNDGRFLAVEEMLARCGATVSGEQYLQWFDQMPKKNQEELERDWGKAPGTFMAVDDQLLVPGIQNGNLFIGLQPPRAFEEKAEEAYHSADLVCPHQYLAFYRYLEKVFRADVLVHLGTHGTLEWLPGKEIGLSDECWPDLALGDIPHIYPYIIDVPGEGVQAKRRSSAVILDHCIPSITESGSYGEMENLESLTDDYYHAKTADPGKMGALEQEIWEQICRQNFQTDLKLTEESYWSDPGKGIERLHLWLSDIKRSKIKDGLHIFGKIPEGDRFWNLIRQLVSISNGDVPSLLEAAAEDEGEDLEELLAHPEGERADGRTNAMRLEELEETGRRYVEELKKELDKEGEETDGWTESETEGERPKNCIMETETYRKLLEIYKNTPGARGACMRFVLNEAVPRLQNVTDELKYFGEALDGRFVPPGPSGAPTRGNARLLPTGRNFYTIDPTAVPSRSSWRTGKQLADQLLDSYLKEEGKYPENVAIVVYSGETMKTRGDDIAEILYLYGVRPVWLAQTDRVVGLEVIPHEELGRPRIDVTLRISGLFRDTFPNLIERIEDGVNLVASLEEAEEDNFVRKHINQDLDEFLREGMQREQAYERASLRVFGCPPGTYGAGVEILINSKKWNTPDDLARSYMNWSSHGYSRKLHGEKSEELFAKRLKNCEITVKNISSFETDMLDDEDFYNYHGGLISAVRMASGKAPRSYSTNAADPSHVKTRDIQTETARIMRARICNPKWQNGMKQHGYKGAQEFAAMVDIFFGWDATGAVAEDWMYEAVAENYVLNDEMRKWMEEVNPFALHAISERLLEASRRGMWDAREETLKALEEIYLSIDGDMEEL